jgi:hypothetical protein
VSTDEYETNCGAEVVSGNTGPVLCPKKAKINAIRMARENPTSDFKVFMAECSFKARSSPSGSGKPTPTARYQQGLSEERSAKLGNLLQYYEHRIMLPPQQSVPR